MSNSFNNFLHNLNKNFDSNVSKQFEIYCLQYAMEPSVENSIDKLSNKLMNAIHEHINQIQYTKVCFDILLNFVKYCHKNTRVIYQNKIIHLCELYICYKDNNEIITNNNAIQLLNILYSFEQTTNWSQLITKYVNICRYTLLEEYLGLEYTHEINQESIAANLSDKTDYRKAILPGMLSADHPVQSQQMDSDFISMNTHDNDTWHGVEKAEAVSKCFFAYCTLITKMVETGCGSGPVILFMPEILDLTHVCLHFIPSEQHLMNRNSVKNTLVNEKGNVSVLDVSKVATLLKVTILCLHRLILSGCIDMCQLNYTIYMSISNFMYVL